MGQEHLHQKVGHPGKKDFTPERLGNGGYDPQLGEETEAGSGKRMMQVGENKRDVRNDKIGQKDTHLKCMYAHSLKNKHGDPEHYMQNCKIAGTTEMWWDSLYDSSKGWIQELQEWQVGRGKKSCLLCEEAA